MKSIKSVFFICMVWSGFFNVFAQVQEKKLSDYRETPKTLVSVALFPAFYLNTETLLFKNITLKNEAGIPWGLGISDKLHFSYEVVHTSGLNWYYNFSKRKQKGKNILGFSGNYIGVFSSFGLFAPYLTKFDIPYDEYLKRHWSVGAWFGMQRTFGKRQRGFLDWKAGVQYFPYAFVPKLSPTLQLRVGFRLTRVGK